MVAVVMVAVACGGLLFFFFFFLVLRVSVRQPASRPVKPVKPDTLSHSSRAFLLNLKRWGVVY